MVTGLDSTQPNDGRTPSVVLADVWDGTAWRRLPATGQLDNNWYWHGHADGRPRSPPAWTAGRSIPTRTPIQRAASSIPRRVCGAPSPTTSRRASTAGDSTRPVARWVATYGQVYDTETGRVTRLPRPDGAPDYGVTAVWAGDSLLAFGGATFDQQTETTNRAWLYTP